MQVDIICRDFPITEFIRYHVDERLSRLLAWNRRRIERVRVTLGDLNGPRGGVDKFCHITVDLRSGHTVRVEQTALDLYDAITRCVARTERKVADVIDRERRRERRLGLGRMW